MAVVEICRNRLLGRLVAALTSIGPSLGLRPSELAQHGIGHAGLLVLKYLNAHGPSRMSKAAAALGVTNASITGTATNLVRDGLVDRLAEPHDRRVVLMEITARGREKLEEVTRSALRRANAAADGVSDHELSALVELIERLAQTTARIESDEIRSTRDVEGMS